jgi:hypothetical protein
MAAHQSVEHKQASWKRLINGFDLMVIAGGLVNVVVISLLFVGWLKYG